MNRRLGRDETKCVRKRAHSKSTHAYLIREEERDAQIILCVRTHKREISLDKILMMMMVVTLKSFVCSQSIIGNTYI